MAHKKTAIVIGAGVGGVATAARLQKAGFQVTVVEKNEQNPSGEGQTATGGRCSLVYLNGFRFDVGPSLLLLPDMFKMAFEDLGAKLEDEVELLKCEPNYNVWFADGERVILSSDLSVMKTEIEKWEGTDGFERYTKFLAESHRHYHISVEHVLLKNFPSLVSMLRPDFLKHLLELHPFESIWTRVSKYFFTERLRRVMTFGSMYMGMSPYDAPGTYSLLQYTELAEGIWYPRGGFHKVVEALVRIGERLGVKYRFGAPVESILLSADGSAAEGVRLASGEVMKADIVVNNSDLVYAYNHLLPKTPYAETLSKRPGSCSSISFYWALSKKVPELETHNIFLADEYKESFDSIFKKHLIPDEPSFYVNVPSRVDHTAAPEGGESVVVLVPVGHLIGPAAKHPSDINDGQAKQTDATIKDVSKHDTGILPTATQDWPAMIALARKTILSTIKARTGADLGPLIVHEISNDPTTWQRRFNLDKGAILGLSHSFFNVLAFRPTTRARFPHVLDSRLGSGIFERIVMAVIDACRPGSRDIKGLYMVGASTTPGTGVPIVLAGSRLVAEQCLDDLGMQIPWRQQRPLRTKSSLDVERKPFWLDDNASWLFLVFAGSSIGWALIIALLVSRFM